MSANAPKFYFSVVVVGWEAGSVFADFCKKNNIDAQPSLNGSVPKQPRSITINRKRLTLSDVKKIEQFIRNNPTLNDTECSKRLIDYKPGNFWRIRKGLHALQQKPRTPAKA